MGYRNVSEMGITERTGHVLARYKPFPVFQPFANQKDHPLQQIQEQTLSVQRLKSLPRLHDSVPVFTGTRQLHEKL